MAIVKITKVDSNSKGGTEYTRIDIRDGTTSIELNREDAKFVATTILKRLAQLESDVAPVDLDKIIDDAVAEGRVEYAVAAS
jgi:hypothetical protein